MPNSSNLNSLHRQWMKRQNILHKLYKSKQALSLSEKGLLNCYKISLYFILLNLRVVDHYIREHQMASVLF